MRVVDGSYEAFEKNRVGCVIGEDLRQQYGWEVGDSVPLIGTIFPQADGSALFQTENQTLDLVFSEALGASISELNLELALTFAGGAIDGDNLPTLGTGANPIALTTTTVANDTLRITFNTNNTPNLDWLRVGTHTVQVGDGTSLDDVPGNDANTTSPAVTITVRPAPMPNVSRAAARSPASAGRNASVSTPFGMRTMSAR